MTFPARSSPETVNVLYILGAGRSGSTVFGDALALLQRSRHVGELRGVFDYTTDPRGVMRCSCGVRYAECSYWGPIFAELWGSEWPSAFDGFVIEGITPHSRQLALYHLVRGPARLEAKLPPSLTAGLREVRRLLGVLANRPGPSQVIIDSSKAGVCAWLLSRQPGVRLICVHLVRDPRATVHSWTNRAIPLPDLQVPRSWDLGTLSGFDAIRDWARANIGAYLVRLYGLPYLRVRYEDFVRDPVSTVAQVCRFAATHGISVDMGAGAADALHRRTIPLSDRHLIGGNQGVKAQRDAAVLREDVAWRKEMPLWKRVVLTALFFPFLVWLGYPTWSRGRHSPSAGGGS